MSALKPEGMDVKSARRLYPIAAMLIFSVSLAGGQESPDPAVLAGNVANWPAPASWGPAARLASVQEREGGLDVYPELVVYDREGRPETVRYHLEVRP